MKEKLLAMLQKLYEDKKIQALLEHFIKPLITTILLSIVFFVIMYNASGNNSIKDTFFIFYAFLTPLVINCAMSFFKLDRRRLYAAYGVSVVSVPFIAVLVLILGSRYSSLPDFYREFNESGSFFLIYIIYAIFFPICSMALGLLDEYFAAETRAALKYPETGGSLSKSKRRKMKKKKRGDSKSDAASGMLDEIIGEDVSSDKFDGDLKLNFDKPEPEDDEEFDSDEKEPEDEADKSKLSGDKK